MKLTHGTWVMVLDGEKYLLLRNQGDAEIIDLRVVEHDEIENPPTHDQGTEKPGRLPDAGQGRSAVEQTDWHALEKANFAGDVADRLKNWALKNRFSELLVCADPKTLGTIRPKYHGEVSRRLVGEIDKDLTSLPVDQVEKVIKAA
jgi:protein required for attachment to host cells